MVLEARGHQQNCFITLTYEDENLPLDRGLRRKDLTSFFKKLRKAKHPFRYYACGEYGTDTKRAHYHACLFGIDFTDKVELERRDEDILYYSQELTDIWALGNTSVGELNFQTAAYCARYIVQTKKGKALREGKGTFLLDETTGEMIPVEEPYAVMSRRPGIATEWLMKYSGDIYSADKDLLRIRGQEMKPPKHFDRLMDTIDPERIARIKKRRKEEREPKTLEELRAHELITRAKLKQKK